MQDLTTFLARAFGLRGFERELMTAALVLFGALVVALLVLTIAGIVTWAERRVAGRAQSRVGPNRVGPFGFLQWMADGAKLLTKEDVIPALADRPLFRLAPYLAVVGVFSAFATIPFGRHLIAADLDVGVIYLVAITSLLVVGVLMAGWSSNNKWALLGGVRSAAQIVAYEVPSVMALLSLVLVAGTLSLQGIVAQQGGWPWQWLIFHNPAMIVVFFLFFTASIAEGNRTPFDLPEAESELVAGYNVEYSGMRFAGFFLGEFANVYLMSAIAAVLFFGGWQVPGLAGEGRVLPELTGAIVLAAKAGALAFVVLWVRWTLPRLRVDQLLGLCYRYLLPLAFAMLLVNGLYVWLVPSGAAKLISYATTALGLGLMLLFVRRVVYHVHKTHMATGIDLARGERGVFDPSSQTRRYGAFRRSKGAR